MRQPAIALVNLSNEEKALYAEATWKNLKNGIFIYLIPCAAFGTIVGLSNVYNEKMGLYDHPDLRGLLNLLLVILTILPARFFVSLVLKNRKAQNAWQKKVIRGVVQKIDGKTITLVNQNLKLSQKEISKWKVNDYIIVSISPAEDYIFSVVAGQEEE